MGSNTFATLLGNAWRYAQRSGWDGLERMLNPNLEFDRVHVISFYDEHEYDTLNYGTLQIHPFPRLPGKLLRFPLLKSWRIARFTKRIVERYDIPLLTYLYGNILDNGVPTVLAAQWSGVPSLVSVINDYHQYFRTRPYYLRLYALNDLLEGYVYRRATRIKCISEYLTDYVLAHGVDRAKISHIPLKLDLSVFSTPGNEEKRQFRRKHGLTVTREEVLILCVAKLSPQKNLKRMLRALARLTSITDRWKFIVAGSGPLEPELRRLSLELRIDGHVHFLGWMPQDELRCAYALSDIFLFPTLYEGQGRVVFEALSYGLPVIGSSFGPVPEMVEDGYNGLLVDPEDTEGIAAAVRRLVQDDEFREELSANAPTGIDERFSFKIVGKQEAELYRELIMQGQHEND